MPSHLRNGADERRAILLVGQTSGFALSTAMDGLTPPRFDVKALHVHLRERIAALRPLVVADATRIFIEVSSLACDQVLWSFEFAFDEDDSRIARLEARFAKHGGPIRAAEEQDGYQVHLQLPRIIPAHAPAPDVRVAVHAPAGSLAARFVRALDELGAYRTIERLEVTAEVDLL